MSDMSHRYKSSESIGGTISVTQTRPLSLHALEEVLCISVKQRSASLFQQRSIQTPRNPFLQAEISSLKPRLSPDLGPRHVASSLQDAWMREWTTERASELDGTHSIPHAKDIDAVHIGGCLEIIIVSSRSRCCTPQYLLMG